ncbi:MAG TPA: polysaccharide deacetylase family protein [Fulvivirga sp.]|nr:polysaccharide deacetylase family protein [Fulvivirga sp.]
MSPFKKIRLYFINAIVIIYAIDYFYDIHWIFYAIPLFIFLFYLIAGSATLSLNTFIKSYTHPKSNKKELALTFDDGPSPNTLAVLDTLKNYNAKATFFCIGHRIDKHPEIMKRIVAEGHTLGNHSYSHSIWFPVFRSKKITQEINKTNDLITHYTGKENRLFRPPFGVMTPGIAKAITKTRQLVMGWSIRSFDTSTKDINKVIKRVQKKLVGSNVLLLHDDRENTPAILEPILQFALDNGYQFVDLPYIFNLAKK